MRKSNKWALGAADLVTPPLPAHLRVQSRVLLQEATFDPTVGQEVYLAILEDTEYAEVLAAARPFELFCKSAMARTSHGVILCLLFTVRRRGSEVVRYELFLNPYEMQTIQLLSGWGQQSHLKVLLIDYQRDQVRTWFEFDNNFGMSDVVAAVAQCIGHEAPGNFQLAQEEFMRDFSLGDT